MALGVNIVSSFDSKGIRKAITDFKALEGAGNKATFGLRTLDSAATNGFKNIVKYGGIAAIGLGTMATHFVKTAEDAAVADAVLLQVATSMGIFGSQTKFVVDRLSELASNQQLSLGIDEDVIKNTQAKLLTFKNLAVTAGEVGGAFDRATMAALDLAATGFGEATSNAVQLGKALQDPIKGITALSKAGVTFTAQEKEKITALVQSGKMLEAQDTLLKAIETQVSGTAEASAKSTVKIGLAFGEIAESLGTLLLPLFESLATLVNNKVVPYVRNLVDVIGKDGVGGGIKLLAGDLLDATTNMGAFGDTILALVAAFTALKLITIAATIAQTAFDTALFANPIGIVVAAVIALVVALVALYVRFESVRTVINTLGLVLKTAFMNVIEAIYNAFALLYNAVAQSINYLIKGANLFGANIPEIEMLGLRAFTVIGNSATKAAGKVAQVTKSVQQLARESDLLTGNLVIKPPVPTGTGAAVKTLAENIKSYREAVLKAVDANKSLANATQGVKDAQTALGDATHKIELAQRGVTKASDDVTKAIDGVTKAQRSVTKASDDVTKAIEGVTKSQTNTANARTDYQKSIDETTKAQNNLTKATTSTKKAQDAFDAAVKGYGANSKQGKKSQRELTEAQRDAEKAGYDAEKSVFDLAEAEKELEAVRADALSTPQMIREAEINLAEAKLSLTEAQINQEDSQISVTEATTLYDQVLNGVKEDSVIYKDLLEELNDKKAAEAQAIIAVTDARTAEAEALVKIAESLTAEAEAVTAVEDARYALADAVTAEGEAVKGVEDAKFALAEAELAVTKAKDDEAKASRDLATAQLEEAKSLLAIAEAQKEVNKQKVEAGKMAGGKAALTKVDSSLESVRGLVNNALALVGQTKGVRMMAGGGIVTRPTAAIIGERGAEAVIPLSKMGRFGGGTAINISVNAGMGADGADIGQQIIDAIRKAERRSGKVFAAA